MDEMRMIRELYAEPLAPSSDETTEARAKLDALFRRRRRPGMRWIIPGVGLAAVATVGAVIVVAPSGQGAGSPSASGPISARRVLLAAVASSIRAPKTQGAYWLTQYRQGALRIVRGRGESYVVEERRETKDWTSAGSPRRTTAETKAGRGGTTTHYWAERGLGVRPVRPSDVAAWKRAGSPAEFAIPIRGTTPGRLSAAPTLWRTFREQTAFDAAFADGSLRDLRNLPADPTRLRRYLLSRPHGDQRNRQVWETDSQWLLDAAGTMLAFEPVSAKVRAAAYRMLAALPEVHALGVKDPLGRPGVAVTVPEPGHDEHRLIIEPATGRLLADEHVAAHGGQLPPGMLEHWQALVFAGWTDTAPKNATTPPG